MAAIRSRSCWSSDGNFYGTTAYGGAYGEGSVFTVGPIGTLTPIYSFCTQIACTDGASPHDGLVLGSDGSFYGPTYFGGTHNQGTLFQYAAGALNTLHDFDGTDGRYPVQHCSKPPTALFTG